ncbi:hypothetical protein, partial [Burkholderia sp. SIMBA_019]|uniref:hypothetical protein n=1 Tax=Burkholderia sp. SIMBA_019 TaxID=3085765 RepID=UPI0039792BE5
RKLLDVVADRFRLRQVDKQRVVEAIEASLTRGGGRVNIYVLPSTSEAPGVLPETNASEQQIWRFSTGLHNPESDLRYA